MAEQKIDDSKSPLARRAVRPFVGPAGGGAASGPLLRPTPATRANPAPFVPPVGPRRPALGTAPGAAAPESGTAPLRPPTPAQSFELTVAAPTPARPVEEERIERAAFVPNEQHTPGPDSHALGTSDHAPEAEAAESASIQPSRRRPVTSEMVAVDAYEAFDAVWGASITPQASPIVDPSPSPVDAESLGSGVDGPNPWTDEMTMATESAPTSVVHQEATPQNSQGDATDPWSLSVTPDSALPAWLLDEPTVTERAPEPEPAIALIGNPGDAGASTAEPEVVFTDVASDAGQVAAAETRAELSATGERSDAYHSRDVVPTELRPADTPVEQHVAPIVSQDPESAAPTSSELFASRPAVPIAAHVTADIRVSAALERLAERVRGGEIDVSSVAPEAPDAAMLASVLAALLGGSSRH